MPRKQVVKDLVRNDEPPLEGYDVVIDEDALVTLFQHEKAFQAEFAHDISHAFRRAGDIVPGHLRSVRHLVQQVEVSLAVVSEIQFLQLANDVEAEGRLRVAEIPEESRYVLVDVRPLVIIYDRLDHRHRGIPSVKCRQGFDKIVEEFLFSLS